MARAGGALFDTISALRDGQDTAGLDIAALNGQDTDLVIDAIVHALVPADGDADRARVAMNEALSKCLEGMDEFDSAHITDEMIVEMMVTYVTTCIFEQIMLDSRDAFTKTSSAERAEQAEKDLHELVAAATDKHMAPLLSGNVRTLTGAQIENVQINAIREIWTEWEAYQP
tara:strand:+ start:1280 stop:1795 length:516 start_codon:yes stop_codon:yes gene_type:complete